MLLHDKLKDYRLWLGSQSPRRRQLMAEAGFAFEVAPDAGVDETYPADMDIKEVPLYLSRLKSRACPVEPGPRDILVTADTVVCIGGRLLGKPADRAGAVEMLESLSGNVHEVVTGVTLRTEGREHTFSSVSKVFFRYLQPEEIAYYVDTCRPYDKAGAYGIQEWIGYVAIERIEGSFYNVMGLPVQKLYTELSYFLNNAPAR